MFLRTRKYHVIAISKLCDCSCTLIIERSGADGIEPFKHLSNNAKAACFI